MSPPFLRPFIGDPNSENDHKLDLFKGLLGADEDQVVGEEIEKGRMSEVKMNRDELKNLMREAMAASREDVLNQTRSSAQGGEDETGINALSVKLSNFWTEDPESWFDRADNQFLVRGIKEDATKFAYVV